MSQSTVDTAPVTVTASTPADQATGIATNGTVTATFDKAITQGTLAMTVKTAAGANVGQRLLEDRHLLGAPDQREPGAFFLPGARHRSDRHGTHGLGLALDHERCQLGGVEDRL